MKKLLIYYIRKIKYFLFYKIKRVYFIKIVREGAKEVGENLFVNSKSSVTKHTIIGDNVALNGLIIGGNGKVVIGDNTRIGRDVLIITSNHNYNQPQKLPYDEKLISKSVIVNNNVWIGQRVTILPGVELGEGSIIQAGSVVVSDIPKYSIAGGNPAKVFKYRDIEHYNYLKNNR